MSDDFVVFFKHLDDSKRIRVVHVTLWWKLGSIKWGLQIPHCWPFLMTSSLVFVECAVWPVYFPCVFLMTVNVGFDNINKGN